MVATHKITSRTGLTYAQQWARTHPVARAATTAPAAPSPVAATTPAAPAQSDTAFQSLLGVLADNGLQAFADLAWNDYKTGRTDVGLILSDIRASPVFDQTFGAGASKLIQTGYFGSAGDLVRYHDTVRDLFHAYGIPDAFAATYASPDNLNKLALGNVSAHEIEQRLQVAQEAATASLSPEVRAELARTTGVTTGDLTAHWLDPNIGLATAQNQLGAAQIGATSDQTGYGQLDVDKLMQLAAQGVSTDAARQGFSTLAGERQLFTALPGQTQDTIGQNAQIAAQFQGSAPDVLSIEAARRQRLNQFAVGGAAAADQQGITGLAPNRT